MLCIHGKIKNAFRFNFFRRTHENVLGQRYNEWISSDQFRKRTKIKINWTFYVFFVVNIFCLANFVFFFIKLVTPIWFLNWITKFYSSILMTSSAPVTITKWYASLNRMAKKKKEWKRVFILVSALVFDGFFHWYYSALCSCTKHSCCATSLNIQRKILTEKMFSFLFFYSNISVRLLWMRF